MGPYKPLRNWADFDHPLLYGNNGSLNNPRGPKGHSFKNRLEKNTILLVVFFFANKSTGLSYFNGLSLDLQVV